MGKVSKSLLVLGVLASISAPVQPLLAATNTSSENENSAAENSESTTKMVSGSSVELSSSSSSISTSSSSANASTSSSDNSTTGISSSTKVESSSTSDSTTSSTEDAKQPSTGTTDEVKNEDALKANSLFGPGYYPEDFQKKISFRSGRNPFIRNTTSFLGGIKNGLQSGWNKHGVLPSVSAAQAILESGWGQSRLAIDGKNLFGIKGDYNGDYVVMPTQEYVNGCWITINAAFRKYPTWNESVEDHGYFLAVNPRYNNLIGETDYRKVTKYLQQDGYATAPNYSAYLNQLIQTYNLTSYDTHRYLSIVSQKVVNYGGLIKQNNRNDGMYLNGP
ncbi:glycoside hydrolase family 73 protein, partial [Lapidilactobacillus dextrinicus]